MPAALLQLDHIIVGHDLTIRDVTIHQYFDPERRDPAGRNRQAMLEKVWAIWITGVLQPSLPHDILLDLGLTERPAMVTRTLDLYVQRADPADPLLAPGTRLVDVFDRLDRALLILGAPGAGKTTLLLTLARDLLQRAAQAPEHPIPVIFPLSSWAERRRPLAPWLIDALNEQYDVPRKLGQVWVDADQILPLLDGLDEVKAEHRTACVEAINIFRQEHGLLPLAVCSRVADYDALGTRLRLQGVLVVQSLTREQVESYLTQVGPPMAAMRQALQEDPMIEGLLDTPLMLAIVTLAYAGEPVEALRTWGTPGERRQHLFAVYVDRMFRRRRAMTRYTRPQTERWLAWLAWQLTQHSQTVLYLERLQPDWLPVGRRWVPTHGTRLLASLVGMLLGGLPIGLVTGLHVRLDTGLIFGLIVALIAALIGGLTGYSKEITPIEMVRWSWSRCLSELLFPSRRGLHAGLVFGLLAALLIGLGFGLRVGLLAGPDSRLHTGLAAGLPVGLGAGLGAVLGVGLVVGLGTGPLAGVAGGLPVGLGAELGWGLLAGLPAGLLAGLAHKLSTSLAAGLSGGEITTKTVPNEGIYRSARMAVCSGLGAGLGAGLLAGLPFGLLAGPLAGLPFGLVAGPLVGLATGFRYGGRACLQHLMLRLGLRYYDCMPRSYADFLDYAAERLFLRRVGGGYTFIHGLLQDDFAARYALNTDAVPMATRRKILTGVTAVVCLIALGIAAHQLWPLSAADYFSRAETHYRQGAYDKAIADASEVIRLTPQFIWAYATRAEAYLAQGAYDKAIADASEAIRLDPQFTRAYLTRAAAYRAQGAYDKAIADASEVIRVDPLNTGAYVVRAEAYLTQGAYDKAIADASEVIRLTPQFIRAYATRAEAYLAQGAYDKAIADASEAIRLDPPYTGAYVVRAGAYLAQGAYDKAIADASEALAFDKTDALAYFRRGEAYRLKGDYDKAIQDYTEALTLYPQGANLYRRRAMAYEQKGDKIQAEADYQEAKRLESLRSN